MTGDDLFRLHRDGLLVARYPDVGPLLADLSDTDLARAGRLLSRLDADEILRAHPAVPTVGVAVTGHGTLAELVPALTAELARHGLLLRPHVSAFDSYVFDLGDAGSELYATAADLTLCVLDPAVVLDEVPVPWQVADVERVLDSRLGVLAGLAARFAATSSGTLVFNTVPLPRRVTAQLTDLRSRAALGAVWRDANARLLRLTDDHASLVVLDLDPLLAEGVPASDPRMSVYARAHLSAELLARYAREVGHLARHLTGRTKKTLVLDLDNTVWGGVLGDVGTEGIEVADGYRGGAFRAFQRVLKQVAAQGVLLTAASKNDVEPVRAALRDHPAMTLREDDFVAIAASWRPKHDTLLDLATDLNLNPDAMVFADDNPAECELIRQKLPGVTVLQLDGDPALHVDRLLRDGWFDVRDLTAEDRTRAVRYRDQQARRDFLDSFESIADYLRELRITVVLRPAGEDDVGRVSQLTLRTNQFNLTNHRLQPPQVDALLADPDAQVLTIHSADRFGDNGPVGAVLTRRDGDTVRIDNFLLSCRVFSRGIEQACLAALLRHARATGARAVVADYRRTARNGNVAQFYPRYGFQPVDDDGTTARFRHDLIDIVAVPGHIQLTDLLGGPRP